MKKILMIGIVLAAIAMSLTSINNTFAAKLGGQSIDVTVGEVDKMDTDEDEDADAPQTGVFGLESNKEFIATSVVLTIPLMIILTLLFKKLYLCFKGNRFTK